MRRRTKAEKQADCPHDKSWSRFVEPVEGHYRAVCYWCGFVIEEAHPVLLKRAVSRYLDG